MDAKDLATWILDKMTLLATTYYPLALLLKRHGWEATKLEPINMVEHDSTVQLDFRLTFRRLGPKA